MPELPRPTVRTCATMPVHERLLRTAHGYREARDVCENDAWRAARAPAAVRRRTGCTVVPVVVHVLYNSSGQNVPDDQVRSQIEVLNADFRMQNPDLETAPDPFRSRAGDARVQFELAETDPGGKPTGGIVRVHTGAESFVDNDTMKFAGTGGSDAWPADTYLNIWVCPLAGGLLGYAQFPGGPPETDGVVILHTAFGTTGTATAPFNLGRTTTHEVGHWLNLRHIWGDDGTGCHGSDFVDDTPNQGGPNTGKPAYPKLSCNNGPHGDMFVNYMDYVDDASMVLFTEGQVTRMQATLGGARDAIGRVVDPA